MTGPRQLDATGRTSRGLPWSAWEANGDDEGGTIADAVHTSDRSALPAVLTAAHQLIELCAGSGVIGQRHVGLVPAAVGWLVGDVAWVAAARGDRNRWGRAIVVANGSAVVAPALHYTLFPWRVRLGVPVLVQPEGLRGRSAVVYVVLLYAWGLAGATAAWRTPKGGRRWLLVGAVVSVAVRQLASDHLRWIRREAGRNPRWWNRGWQDPRSAAAGVARRGLIIGLR